MKKSRWEAWDDDPTLRRQQKIIRVGGTVGFVGTLALSVWLAVMARIDENATTRTDADTLRTEQPVPPVPPAPADSTAQNLF